MIPENKVEKKVILTQKSPVPGIEDMEMPKVQQAKRINTFVFVIYVVLILMGVGTGYVLNTSIDKGSLAGSTKVTMTKTEKVEGSTDTTTFKDQAEGMIEKGGVDDEGTHKLLREGGPSQTVALVSSVLDLDDYDGKKVKVWGQSFPPQKAGWFMDVGKIELLE